MSAINGIHLAMKRSEMWTRKGTMKQQTVVVFATQAIRRTDAKCRIKHHDKTSGKKSSYFAYTRVTLPTSIILRTSGRCPPISTRFVCCSPTAYKFMHLTAV